MINLKVLDKEFIKRFGLPEYGTPESAGLDLRANLDGESFIGLNPNEVRLIPTGIAVHIDNPNLCAHILPRSGLGHKKGIILGNAVGLIDSDYQGQLFISCWNRSNEFHIINNGDRIAQLVFMPIHRAEINIVESFETTERGEGGFGSTDTTK